MFLFGLLGFTHSDLDLLSSGLYLHLILNFILLSEVCGPEEMALWFIALAAFPDNASSVPTPTLGSS